MESYRSKHRYCTSESPSERQAYPISNWAIRLVALIVLAVTGQMAECYAYDFVSGGIYYNITSASNLTCEVTYKDINDNTTYHGAINIPAYVNYNNKTLTVTGIGDNAFFHDENVTSVNLPGTITSIGASAFQTCTGLTSITIPGSVQTISGSAIAYCKNLKEVIFKDGDTPLSLYPQKSGGEEYSPFSVTGTSQITYLYIGRNLKSLSLNTFDILTNLTKLEIGKYVQQIGANEFNKCSFNNSNSLQIINCYGSIPPILNNSWSSKPFFSNKVLASAKVKVPKGTLSRYSNADTWKDFWDISEGYWESSIAISLSLSESLLELKTGETHRLKAIILPESLSNDILSWHSSNPAVISVDGTGQVTALAEGTASITCKTIDGSNLSASCSVKVTEAAGIEDILETEDSYIRVFSIKGVLVFEGLCSEAVLSPDVYIIESEGKTVKVIVR